MKRASIRILISAGMSLVLLTSCSPGAEPSASSTPGTETFGRLGMRDCQPPSPIVGQEVQGTGTGAVTAYGDFQGIDPATLTEGVPIKLVVRMTGTGDLAVDMTAPDGSTHRLDWGPESHTASNYDRPGDEWGIGFSFGTPGCWALNLKRDAGDRARFWLVVQKAH